jgi:hypothetical protein
MPAHNLKKAITANFKCTIIQSISLTQDPTHADHTHMFSSSPEHGLTQIDHRLPVRN